MAKRITAQTKAECVHHYKDGTPTYQISEHYGVSETSIRRWYHRWNDGRVKLHTSVDVFDPYNAEKFMYQAFDYDKRKYVGPVYANKTEAETALYGYL